jgi:MFS transporter, PPP family, 3-phenylpropionic acid transporter
MPVRLSSFYLLYFAVLGALVPYWGPYLRSLGFSAAEIGELMALLLATKIVAPYIWGWLTDRGGQRMPIIRGATLLAALIFSGALIAQSYLSIAMVMIGFSFFWNAALPQFEAVTLNHLGTRVERYGRIRLWGSVGFILSVLVLGPVLERGGHGLLPWIVFGLLLVLWLSTLGVSEQRDVRKDAGGGEILSVLRRPEVISLFVVCFLVQASHGPYYSFFTIYLGDAGYGGGVIGWLWALGVVAEVGVFLMMPRLLPMLGARRLMLLALGLTALRWLMIAGFVDKMPLIIGAQLLHMASFGLYHAVAVHFVHRFFSGRLQGRGQALYSSLSFGAGGALGSLAGGHLWEVIGGQGVYLAAAAAAALAFAVACAGLKTSESQQGKHHEQDL